jgi:hypothetical protein
MKQRAFLAALLLGTLAGCGAMALNDSEVGLRKTSVFDVVTPTPFGFDGPGAGKTSPPLPGSGMPPMISHTVDEYLPLTAKANECLDCHDKPDRIGKPVASPARPRPHPPTTTSIAAARWPWPERNTTAWPVTRRKPTRSRWCATLHSERRRRSRGRR